MFSTGNSYDDTQAQIGFLFHVVIGSNILGEFRAVRGLGRTVEAEPIKEGGRNHSPHMMVGQGKYNECKIEWGFSLRATLFDWIHAVEAGYGFRRLVWIFQLDRERNPLRVYQLWDAWPTSWEGARLDANDNSIDTEEINLAYELVTMVGSPGDISLPSMDSVDIGLDDSAFQIAQEYEDLALEGDVGASTSNIRALLRREWETAKVGKYKSNVRWSSPQGKPGRSQSTANSLPLPEKGDSVAGSVSATEQVVAHDALKGGKAGSDAQATSEFEDVEFATGSFAEQEVLAPLRMSAGIFIEPAEWELLAFEEE